MSDAFEAKLAKHIRNLEETSVNEGSHDLACRCADSLELIRELQADVKRMEKIISDPVLAGIDLHHGLTIGLKGAGVQLFAEMFAAQFKEAGAINYIEATMVSQDPDIGELVVTLQRRAGKTPHQLRVEAEQRLSESRAQALEEAAKVCEETPVVTLPGYYSYDDGQRTLDNAAEAIRALAQGGKK